MKKLITGLTLILLLTGIVFAQEGATGIPTIETPPFLPVSPRVMAQGGSFVAVAEGYDSFFYNPAGFARTPFELTIPTTSVWMYMNPAVIDDFIDSIPDEEANSESELTEAEQAMLMLNLINEQVGSGGVGVGLSTGIGVLVQGIAAGCALVVDSYLQGNDGLIDASGEVVGTLGLILGYGLDLDVLGIKLNVGADVRPMYRVHSIVGNRDALMMVSQMVNGEIDAVMDVLSATTALTGLGVGIDIGAIAELGPLSIGLSIRDLFGTRFAYYENEVSTVMDALAGEGEIPETEDNIVDDAEYVIPMNINAGVGFNFDFLKPVLDLTVHGDLQDVIGVIKDKRSPWTLLHMGAEAEILGILKARAGFNQGYITMGAGVHLLFLDINAGFFTRELGKYIKDQPNSGVTVELAIRL